MLHIVLKLYQLLVQPHLEYCTAALSPITVTIYTASRIFLQFSMNKQEDIDQILLKSIESYTGCLQLNLTVSLTLTILVVQDGIDLN